MLEDLKAETAACGLAGWWCVRMTGRGEGWQSQVPCVKGLQLFTGYSHRTLTDGSHCSAEEQKISGTALPSLFKVNSSVRKDLFMQCKAGLGQ